IVRIEYDRHRLGLSLRQARDKAEEDGWAFNESGNVLSAPQEALDRLGVTAPAGSEAAPDTVVSEDGVAAAGDLAVVDAEAETPVAAPTAKTTEDTVPELAQEEPAEAKAAPELTEEESA